MIVNNPPVRFKLAVAILIVLVIICGKNFESLFPRAGTLPDSTHNGSIFAIFEKKNGTIRFNRSGIIDGVQGGHWEYLKGTKPPYVFSPQVCMSSCIHQDDCIKTEKYCPSNLTNWVYKDRNNKPYPRFNVSGFRRNMSNRRIIFVGSSLVRQQVQALVWTLGHNQVKWKMTKSTCASSRWCMLDAKSNITICFQFLGSMATRVYHEDNFTLDHSLRGKGDSSCLLHNDMIADFIKFDLVFVQSIVWFAGLPLSMNSSSSPYEWVSKMVPNVYYDAMDELLSKVSRGTKTVLVLGQVGTKCENKIAPESFNVDVIPASYGWNLGPILWDTSLTLIREKELNVQVVDARHPLMQSVHAHPVLAPVHDCLHFCMNSAAINIYLNMYWVEVFSRYK